MQRRFLWCARRDDADAPKGLRVATDRNAFTRARTPQA
jgi:hypothetical protein